MIEPLAFLWALATAEDPAEIARLEAATGYRQAAPRALAVQDAGA
jgi:hypothetical protein